MLSMASVMNDICYMVDFRLDGEKTIQKVSQSFHPSILSRGQWEPKTEDDKRKIFRR